MFSNLNFWEIGALILLALFIFGPERLPKVISDAARMVRTVRNMARNATSDLSRELGTEVRLEDLHPKTFIRKHLLSEEEEAELRRPFDDAFRDVKQIATETNESLTIKPRSEGAPTTRTSDPAYGSPYGQDNGFPRREPETPEPGRYDSDAT